MRSGYLPGLDGEHRRVTAGSRILDREREDVGPRVVRESLSSSGMSLLKRRLLSGGAWAFGGRLAMAFMALASNALLARLLSPQDLGTYFLAFSVVLVGGQWGAGLGQAVVRFVSESIGLDQFARARRVLSRALVLGVLGSLVIGTAYSLFGQSIGNDVFNAPALAAVTGLVAGWMVVSALQVFLSEAHRGFQDIRLATIFGGLSTGVLLTASLGVLWSLGYRASLFTALLLTVGAGLASVSLSGWLLRRKAASLPSRLAKDDIGFGGIMRVALPLLVVNLTQIVLTQADLWILGAFRPQQEVALYGAAARTVILVAMPMLVVNSVVSPLIAGMYAQGRRRELERVLRATASLAGIPAFLLLAGFALLGGPILGLVFGDYYREGATVLVLLSLGQMVNVWVGACGIALVMTGNHITVMAITVASSVVMVVGGLNVVGPYGATGVAAAAATGVAICNISFWLMAKRKTGMWTHMGFTGLSDLLKAVSRASE